MALVSTIDEDYVVIYILFIIEEGVVLGLVWFKQNHSMPQGWLLQKRGKHNKRHTFRKEWHHLKTVNVARTFGYPKL